MFTAGLVGILVVGTGSGTEGLGGSGKTTAATTLVGCMNSVTGGVITGSIIGGDILVTGLKVCTDAVSVNGADIGIV